MAMKTYSAYEMDIFMAGRRIGKSMFMIDSLLNGDFASMYPSMMNMGMIPAKPNIKKGYRGEWVVELEWSTKEEIKEWCHQTFGEPGHNRRYAWRIHYASGNFNGTRIFLRNEKDVLMFKLRWC